MTLVLAISIGVLFAGGLYCLLRRSLMKLVLGILLVSQGANLLVFTAGSPVVERPTFIASGEDLPYGLYGDPLPQALVLTAIVIGFGLVVFLVALLYRAYDAVGSDDLKTFTQTEDIP